MSILKTLGPKTPVRRILMILILTFGFVLGLIGFTLYRFQKSPSLGGEFTLKIHDQKWSFVEHAKSLNLVYFGYSRCPDVCPMALSFTAQAFRMLTAEEQEKVGVFFMSVDAAHDTPESVTAYAKHFHPGFVGLTGTIAEIDKVVRLFGASYMIEENSNSYLKYSIAHTNRIFIVDQRGYLLDSVPDPKSADDIVKKIRENL